MLVCHAYHAVTSDRPYRRAMPQADAIAELRRCAGTQFDPRVVDAFLAVLETPAGRAPLAGDDDQAECGILPMLAPSHRAPLA